MLIEVSADHVCLHVCMSSFVVSYVVKLCECMYCVLTMLCMYVCVCVWGGQSSQSRRPAERNCRNGIKAGTQLKHVGYTNVAPRLAGIVSAFLCARIKSGVVRSSLAIVVLLPAGESTTHTGLAPFPGFLRLPLLLLSL